MKRLFALVLTVGMVLPQVACRHNVNTNNPKVVLSATLLDASNTTVTIEDGLLAADHVLDQIQAAEPEYYAKVKPLLKKLSSANVVAAQKIQIVKNGGTADWKAAVVAVGSTVKPSDLTAFGFKNPTSQILVADGFATLIAALQLVSQRFGGTK